MTQTLPAAFAASHELKPLPFDPAKLDGFPEKLIRSHWENNYGGSVNAHVPTAILPILVIDRYEHSYQMDFGAAAPAYVDAFFRNIHWETVALRLDKGLKARALLVAGDVR